jgi:hypothetical protein
MKKLVLFIIFYSSFVILLCPSAKAQWEGAKVQRLTYNTSCNDLAGLYIDKNDKLFLFYHQWWWDPYQQPYRDTLYLITKEKGGEWSQPETLSSPSQEQPWCAHYVGYDPHTGLIHLFCARSETLYYTNSNMPNWQMVKTDSGPDQVYPGGIMAFDTLGNIHLAWTVDFDSIGQKRYRVMYANNCTGQWVKQQVSPPIWLGGMRSGGLPGFGVQKNGTAHIVYQGEPYCDTECVAFYVRNDSLNSTNWITDTVPKPSRPLWQYGVGPIKVDVNDRVHLITVGCSHGEYCGPWPGWRTFYYYKQTEDSVWQGPEQIPDTMFGFRSYIPQLFVDKQGVPYMGYQTSSNEEYFTDRNQGSWQVPYYLVGWHTTSASDSFMVDNFCFVLDSQGKGHAAFSAFNFAQGMLEDDSVEIYYFSSSNSAVDTEEDNKTFHSNLFQNYPNPFNSSSIITYEIERGENVTLKIYDILGREVRELINTSQKPDYYKVIWDGRNNSGKEVSSGIYFYQLRAGNYKEARKLVLIK